MKKNVRELRAELGNILDQAKALVEASETEGRDFKPEEQTQYDSLISQAKEIEKRIQRLESMPELPPVPGVGSRGAPNGLCSRSQTRAQS